MIARLRGRLDGLGVDHAVIDVGGVGYLVICAARTLAALPRPGEAVDLHVETQLRAESITLYGFTSAAERSWFRLLQTVQGVGARVALGILSVLDPAELAQAIVARDKTVLTRASGVGARLAGRIVAELESRLGEIAPALAPPAGSAAVPAVATPLGSVADDAVSALVHLGYGRSEAHLAVTRVAASLGATPALDELIRDGLQELAQATGR